MKVFGGDTHPSDKGSTNKDAPGSGFRSIEEAKMVRSQQIPERAQWCGSASGAER